jgi:hypothetical protein
MALRKAAQEAQVENTAPAFEDMDDGVTSDVGTDAPAANEAPAQKAAPATTAVATTTANAVAVSDNAGKKFADEVIAMKGALDLSYGNFKTFKGNNGIIKGTGNDKDAKLGKWVQVTMVAWDEHHEVSPGVSDKAAKDFVAYSKDGKTIDRVISQEVNATWAGQPVSEYLKYLKAEEGYSKADCRPFIDVGCLLLDADNKDTDLIGEMLQLTLSQTSAPSFKSYEQSLKAKAMLAAKGVNIKLPTDPFTFYVHTEIAEKGDNTWTKLAVTSKLPAKL